MGHYTFLTRDAVDDLVKKLKQLAPQSIDEDQWDSLPDKLLKADSNSARTIVRNVLHRADHHYDVDRCVHELCEQSVGRTQVMAAQSLYDVFKLTPQLSMNTVANCLEGIAIELSNEYHALGEDQKEKIREGIKSGKQVWKPFSAPRKIGILRQLASEQKFTDWDGNKAHIGFWDYMIKEADIHAKAIPLRLDPEGKKYNSPGTIALRKDYYERG